MSAIASQITSLTIVYSSVYSDADQRKHQSSASLAIMRGIHRGLVNSPHKWPETRKMFPFEDVIMGYAMLFRALFCGMWLLGHALTSGIITLNPHKGHEWVTKCNGKNEWNYLSIPCSELIASRKSYPRILRLFVLYLKVAFVSNTQLTYNAWI